MYTTRKTELGKLRQYERELTKMYAEAILRKHIDEARSLYDRRHDLRRAILQYEEWNVDTGGVPVGEARASNSQQRSQDARSALYASGG